MTPGKDYERPVDLMAVPRPLGGRYAFVKRIRGTQRTIIWLARDNRKAVTVVASVLPEGRCAGLAPAVGLRHLHAAAVVDVIDSPRLAEMPDEENPGEGARVVVAEYAEGKSLQQRLEAGPVALETAVDWVVTAGDALAALHERGGVHGALQPRSLLVVRSGSQVTPLLTHLLVPPSGAYCSPERVTGGGPSASDDTWALAATLYTAIARRPPFRGASRTELARAIVAASPEQLNDVDPVLWDIIERGLAQDPGRRLSTAAGFRDALRDWVDETGRRSTGDFAPVEAIPGFSEPPPAVGDHSLVMALVRPDTAEANAPLFADRSFNDPLDGRDGSLAPPSVDGPPSLETPFSLAPPSEDAIATSDSQPMPSLDAVAIPNASRATSDTAPELQRTPPPPLPSIPLPARAGERDATTPIHAARDVEAAKRDAGRRAPLGGRIAIGAIAAALLAGGVFVLSKRTPPAPVVASPPAAPAKTVDLAPQEIPASAVDPVPEAVPPSSAAAPASAAPEPVPAESAAPAESAPAPAESAGAQTGVARPLMACLLNTLPEGTLSSGAHVGFLCDQDEIWTVARRFNQEVARTGSGAGLVQWAHLARYDLAAISTLRTRCCPAAPPFSVATPKGLCDTLQAATADVGKDPSTAAAVDAYAQGVDCLVSKGVRYPAEWWDRVAAKDARGYFEKFVGSLR